MLLTYVYGHCTPTANMKLLELMDMAEGVLSWKLSSWELMLVRLTMTMKRSMST